MAVVWQEPARRTSEQMAGALMAAVSPARWRPVNEQLGGEGRFLGARAGLESGADVPGLERPDLRGKSGRRPGGMRAPWPVTLEGRFVSLVPLSLELAPDLHGAGEDRGVWRYLPIAAPEHLQ